MTPLRISALGIALLGGAGLFKAVWLPEKQCVRAGAFVFYTNLSNLLVVVYELLLGLFGARLPWLTAPGVALSATLCVYVTHLIFAYVLVPDAKRRQDAAWLEGLGAFGNLCVHYITPGLVVAQWLLWQDKAGLTVWNAVWWLSLPLAYFAFAMLRARTGKPIGRSKAMYPYPFLELPRLGARRFCVNVAVILAGFFALGAAFVWLGGKLG